MADRSNSCGAGELAALFSLAAIRSSLMHSNAWGEASHCHAAELSWDDWNLSAHLHTGKKIRVVEFLNTETRQKNDLARNGEDGKLCLARNARPSVFRDLAVRSTC